MSESVKRAARRLDAAVNEARKEQGLPPRKRGEEFSTVSMSTREKVSALVEFFGYSREEAREVLADRGELD